MKKFATSFVIAGLAMLFMTGCCLKHDYADATCKEPQTCVKCGKTVGDTLDHEWEDATCAHPKTCSLCGKEKGDTLPHTWLDATCENPMTCSVCGATEGEALGHFWMDATCERPKTCYICDATEGEPLEHEWHYATVDSPKYCINCYVEEGEPVYFKEIVFSDYGFDPSSFLYCHNDILFFIEKSDKEYSIVEYDLDGKLRKTLTHDRLNAKGDMSCGFNIAIWDEFIYESFDTNPGAADDTVVYQFESYEGKVLAKVEYGRDEVSANFYDGHTPYIRSTASPDYYEVYDAVTGEVMGAYQVSTQKWIEASSYKAPATKDTTYYGSWPEGYYMENVGIYMVFDGSVMGYVDEDDNILGKWYAVTKFTDDGLAFVSDYGLYWDLVDTDMNVVGYSVLYASGVVRVSDGVYVTKNGSTYTSIVIVKNVE